MGVNPLTPTHHPQAPSPLGGTFRLDFPEPPATATSPTANGFSWNLGEAHLEYPARRRTGPPTNHPPGLLNRGQLPIWSLVYFSKGPQVHPTPSIPTLTSPLPHWGTCGSCHLSGVGQGKDCLKDTLVGWGQPTEKGQNFPLWLEGSAWRQSSLEL